MNRQQYRDILYKNEWSGGVMRVGVLELCVHERGGWSLWDLRKRNRSHTEVEAEVREKIGRITGVNSVIAWHTARGRIRTGSHKETKTCKLKAISAALDWIINNVKETSPGL